MTDKQIENVSKYFIYFIEKARLGGKYLSRKWNKNRWEYDYGKNHHKKVNHTPSLFNNVLDDKQSVHSASNTKTESKPFSLIQDELTNKEKKSKEQASTKNLFLGSIEKFTKTDYKPSVNIEGNINEIIDKVKNVLLQEGLDSKAKDFTDKAYKTKDLESIKKLAKEYVVTLENNFDTMPKNKKFDKKRYKEVSVNGKIMYQGIGSDGILTGKPEKTIEAAIENADYWDEIDLSQDTRTESQKPYGAKQWTKEAKDLDFNDLSQIWESSKYSNNSENNFDTMSENKNIEVQKEVSSKLITNIISFDEHIKNLDISDLNKNIAKAVYNNIKNETKSQLEKRLEIIKKLPEKNQIPGLTAINYALSNLNNKKLNEFKKSFLPLKISNKKLIPFTRIRLFGLPIIIEKKKGTYRTGTDQNGKMWATKLDSDYGYIQKTLGADNEQIDCFIGHNLHSELVYVINQKFPTGKFDEHKIMLGYNSKEEALQSYFNNNKKDKFVYDSMEVLTLPQFKQWLMTGSKMKKMQINLVKFKSLLIEKLQENNFFKLK